MNSAPSDLTAGSPLSVAIAGVAGQIAQLLRSTPDPSVPIPGARWTVGEAGAHLVLAGELMADLAAGRERAYGDGTAGSLAAANELSLAGFTERDGGVLADGIVRHAQAFTDAAAPRPADRPVVTPLGPMDLGTLGSYLLTHLLGHGYDIAVALGRPHMIDRERVGLTLPFVTTAMPRVVDPRAAAGHNARYELRLRGGPRFGVDFTDGAVTVTEEVPRRPDCTIVAEPVTFLLIALGRRTSTGALARGKILAWGRRPWLAPGFPALFTAP
ncbi:TIGR03083 family protein [Actinacidiphila yanglinensis]|uniref:TIGR03083 family protein n=1 Tax=Actinacidiphila yanglinensis TaxID=310779 RepID=A0A1H6DE74_9ACTN|nr:maleylpyruvate isomerase family mycothiol-dependent enzyme [Actinacidiphila yanglinensis]SEG83550.1 TIGR03083 family protein [Actinacidiphila yanglinensis]